MGSLHHPNWNTPASTRFTIGRDHHGWWVVHDRLGRIGGLFASEEAASHFAIQESDRDPHMVCKAPNGTAVEPFDDRADEQAASIGRRVMAHNHRLRRA
jgi:hypothetical protein